MPSKKPSRTLTHLVTKKRGALLNTLLVYFNGHRTLLAIFIITLIVSGIVLTKHVSPISQVAAAEINITNPANNPLMLLGSNLGAWGMNSDGSINEPFVNNSTQQSLATKALGTIRMPTRSNLTDSAIIKLADIIRSTGLEPLVILPAADLSRSERYVKMLGSKVIYYEFGNEDNYFKSWSGATYASYWIGAIKTLRAVNPNAKFGGPVGSHVGSAGSQYITDFLENIKSDSSLYPDFISFHLYSEHGEDKTSSAVLQDVSTWGARIDWIRNTTQAKLGRDLPIACTEWNWDAAPENTGDNRDMDATFMNEFTTAVLDQWRTHGVWMSHQYGYGAGMGGGHLQMINGSTAKPQYNAMLAYKNSGKLGTYTTPIPTAIPTKAPTATPTKVPTLTPKPTATLTPTKVPTLTPKPTSTIIPTAIPTKAPTAVLTKTPTMPPAKCLICPNNSQLKKIGDADCSGVVTINDRSMWRAEFITGGLGTVVKNTWNADFDCDGTVSLNDVSIWRQNFLINLRI